MSGKINETSNKCHICFGVMIALIMIMVGNTASAQINVDETKTIDKDGFYKIPLIGIKAGDILNVNVQVTEGGPVDIMLMLSSDYYKYMKATYDIHDNNWRFYVIPQGSSDSIKSKTYSYTFPETPEDGPFYLVIDNTAVPVTGANPIGPVDVRIKITVEHPTPIPTFTPTPTYTSTPTLTPTWRTPTPIPILTSTPTPKSPGFEAILVVFGIIMALVLRRR